VTERPDQADRAIRALAASDHAAATSAFEAALLSGDPDRIAAAREDLRAQQGSYAQARMDAVAGRRLLPSFEDLLASPTVQADPQSLILASIVAYAAAQPASAAMPAPRFTAAGQNPRYLGGEAVTGGTAGTLTAVG
jgi:hypothetical protein